VAAQRASGASGRDRGGRLARLAGRLASRIPVSAIVALLVTSLAFAMSYLTLNAVLGETQIAGGIASLWFTAGPVVQRNVERQLRAWLPLSMRLPTIAGFERPWWQLAMVAFLAVTAVQLLTPVVSFGGGPATAVNGNVASLLALAPPVIAFLAGMWTGSRSDRYGMPVIVGALLAAYLVARALTPLTVALTGHFVLGAGPPPAGSFDEPECAGSNGGAAGVSAPSPTAGGFGVPPAGVGTLPGPPPVVAPPGPTTGMPPGDPPPDPRCFYGQGIVGFVLGNPLPLLLAAGLLGFWRGRRLRLAAYVGRLLARLPPATRDSIVALAHEEAERLAGGRP